MCILIRTPNVAEDPGMCAYMADGKRGEEEGKRKRRKRKGDEKKMKREKKKN